MSTLTLLTLVVAGVIVAYLLEALLEESTHGLFGVPNRKLSAHLFRPFPDGFYTHYSKKLALYWNWAYALGILGFVWISINIGELFKLAVVYAVLGIFTVSVAFAEMITPKRTFSTALTGWVGKNVDMDTLFLMGLGISAVFIPLNFVMGFGISVKPLLIKGFPWMSLILLGFIIPLFEEAAFGATIGASAIENIGIILGGTLIVFSWVAFHYLAWAPLSVSNIVFLALFRISALVPMIKFKSTLPGYIGHVGVNVSAILISMGGFAI